jgi:hypothetical protein
VKPGDIPVAFAFHTGVNGTVTVVDESKFVGEETVVPSNHILVISIGRFR